MSDDILFLVKYGEERYIKDIVDGKVYFSPSQEYIKIEQKMHEKGQGDLLEGKMVIKFDEARAYHPETNELILCVKGAKLTLSFQDVNSLPVCCMSYGTKNDCEVFESVNNYKIKISEEKAKCIRNDFKNATYALVILEPNKFINFFSKFHNIVAEPIKYFDYQINSIQMYSHILGKDVLALNEKHSMTYKNRHRHLLCKDISFQNQSEFRIILVNNHIDYPQNFEYVNKGFQYLLMPIEEFFIGVEIKK